MVILSILRLGVQIMETTLGQDVLLSSLKVLDLDVIELRVDS